jgi:hypothetical protein
MNSDEVGPACKTSIHRYSDRQALGPLRRQALARPQASHYGASALQDAPTSLISLRLGAIPCKVQAR